MRFLAYLWRRGGAILKVIADTLTCKFCGSPRIVRFGHYKGFQRWWCKACHRKFADNDALPRMHTSRNQVSTALGDYYEGMSIEAIRRQLEQEHQNTPSSSTVYEWILRFTKQAIEDTKDTKPNVGDVWVADETVLKIGGKKVWFWDIIDAKTRFLLASHMSYNRTTRDAQTLMERASRKAGKPPKVVLTDQLFSLS
jgi:putative transposase